MNFRLVPFEKDRAGFLRLKDRGVFPAKYGAIRGAERLIERLEREIRMGRWEVHEQRIDVRLTSTDAVVATWTRNAQGQFERGF